LTQGEGWVKSLRVTIEMWADIFRRARRATVVSLFTGLAIILLLVLMALFPQWFTGYSPYEMYSIPFSPPILIT